MKRPLVVTDPSEGVVDLIREAGELAAATGVPLLVSTVITEDEYENDADVMETIDAVEGSAFNMEPAEYAEKVARTAVTDILSDLAIEAETIGRYIENEGDRAVAILDIAEQNDCDYIFLVGRRRSPTGKAVFGDTAQSVILNFDDYVVTTVE